ncbi:MAG: GDP-mannose 4,6-dehydratase [Endomicrobiales bacterium]|nr:GDP-mannose 4,6-dehydratase [Endomicrobiales bacterium]
MKKTRYLLTGGAGFIGAKTAEKLLEKGGKVVCIDNLNSYYDVKLKKYRIKEFAGNGNFVFLKGDIEDKAFLKSIFKRYKFDAVINLAARAGVRYSMINPGVYLSTNALGTLNLLELTRAHKIKKFVLASTSSLYAGQRMPFLETLAVNTPISPYAASKKAAEAICHAYHHLYGMDVTILRYFTVYGPAGRPDMSVFRFVKQIDTGAPLEVYGDGKQTRDFTYIDDIARGTVKAVKKLGFEIINLGGNKPYELLYMVRLIEKYLGKRAKIRHLPFNKSDIKATWADVRKANRLLNWKPETGLDEGIKRTVDWYLKNKKFVKEIPLVD